MSAAAAPRLTGGIFASVLLHGALIAAFVFLRSSTPLPPPQMIMVSMIAAPAGPSATGVVEAKPEPVTEPPPPATTTPVKPKPAPPKAKPKPAPKVATPEKTLKEPTPKPRAEPAPAAGGGATGGRGADVANIDTPGIQFDYPGYTDNIVRRLVLRFGPMSGTLEAEVRFVIRRDGSVDPSSIRLVTSSHNYSFDQRALSAVEAAANAKEFGPLPAGFSEDILPVTFRFSPRVIR